MLTLLMVLLSPFVLVLLAVTVNPRSGLETEWDDPRPGFATGAAVPPFLGGVTDAD